MSVLSFAEEFPEFASVIARAATAVAAQVVNANAYLSDNAFGEFRDHAVNLLVAHRLRLRFATDEELPQDSPALVTSQSQDTGGMSEGMTPAPQVTSQSAFEADLARTNYGMELLSLIKTSVAPGYLVVSPDVSNIESNTPNILP